MYDSSITNKSTRKGHNVMLPHTRLFHTAQLKQSVCRGVRKIMNINNIKK